MPRHRLDSGDVPVPQQCESRHDHGRLILGWMCLRIPHCTLAPPHTPSHPKSPSPRRPQPLKVSKIAVVPIYNVRCYTGLRIHRQLDNSHVRSAISPSIGQDTSHCRIDYTAPRCWAQHNFRNKEDTPMQSDLDTLFGADKSPDFTLPEAMRRCLSCRFLRQCSRCLYRVWELLEMLTRC